MQYIWYCLFFHYLQKLSALIWHEPRLWKTFKSMGICSHTVAVAHVNGSVKEFFTLYRNIRMHPVHQNCCLPGLANKGNRVSNNCKREPKSSVYLSLVEAVFQKHNLDLVMMLQQSKNSLQEHIQWHTHNRW